jgi:hypothetical protein
VSRATGGSIADRKALLVARAEFERMQITLQTHQLRALILPPRTGRPRGARPGAIAAAVVGIGLPLLGRHRLSRLLKTGSLMLAAWRLARNWRSGR